MGAAGLARPLLGDRRRVGRVTAEGEALALAHGLFWVLATLAERAPIAIVVDDTPLVRRADPALPWLSRPSDASSCRCFWSRRAAPASPWWGPTRSWRPIPRLSCCVRGRSPQGVRQVVKQDFPKADDEFVTACHRVSGGSPFLLRELLRDLAADETVPDAAAAAQVGRLAPRSVSLGVLAQIARLPDPSAKLARAIAVLGEAPLLTAALLAGVDLDQASDAADKLAGAGIVEVGPIVGFTHPLLRTAV